MKRILSLLTIAMLGAWTAAAQTTVSPQAGASAQSQTVAQPNNSASISNGTKIDATLATSLDAKRSKPGDEVEVRAEEDVRQDGKVVLRRGARLVGHVTQTQARSNGQTQSQLGIMFDHAVLKNGQDVPFNASIQAVASAQSMEASSIGADDRMVSGGGMGAMQGTARSGALVGGVATTAGATTGAVMNTSSSIPMNTGGTLNTVARSSGAVGGLTSTGRLSSNSSGVFGLEGLSINPAASSATQGTMIVSTTKNVHLDSGTQLLLRTAGQSQ